MGQQLWREREIALILERDLEKLPFLKIGNRQMQLQCERRRDDDDDVVGGDSRSVHSAVGGLNLISQMESIFKTRKGC